MRYSQRMISMHCAVENRLSRFTCITSFIYNFFLLKCLCMFNLNNHMFWSILSDSRQNRFFGRSNRIDYCGLVPFNLMYYCTGETQAIDLCGFISRIRWTKIKCAINTKHQKQKKKSSDGDKVRAFFSCDFIHWRQWEMWRSPIYGRYKEGW